MISRRLLRAIVMQALYAFFQSANDRVDVAENGIIERINRFKNLYLQQISFLIEIFKFARDRQEEAKNKLKPSKEDLNPNRKFTDSVFIKIIEESQEYKTGIEKNKVNWADEKDLILRTFNKIKNSEAYQQYMMKPYNFEEEKKFIIKLFRTHVEGNSVLKSIYEERNLYWADDYDYINIEIIKLLKDIKEDSGDLNIYKVKENFNEDIDYVKHLFKKTIVHYDEYENYIKAIIKNWETERIATIDMILMKMAICEFLNFEEIPVKVTLNEYIEIAKLYSTPKSSTFINGILDKILEQLKSENKLKKTGRGIIN